MAGSFGRLSQQAPCSRLSSARAASGVFFAKLCESRAYLEDGTHTLRCATCVLSIRHAVSVAAIRLSIFRSRPAPRRRHAPHQQEGERCSRPVVGRRAVRQWHGCQRARGRRGRGRRVARAAAARRWWWYVAPRASILARSPRVAADCKAPVCCCCYCCCCCCCCCCLPTTQ